MRPGRMFLVSVAAAASIVGTGVAFGQGLRLTEYVIVAEAPVAHDPSKDLVLGNMMDRRHNVRITFRKDMLRKGLLSQIKSEQRKEGKVQIRIRAILQRKDAQPQPIPVDNYAIAEQTTENNKPLYKITYNDELYEVRDDGAVADSLPDSFVNVTDHGPKAGDRTGD